MVKVSAKVKPACLKRKWCNAVETVSSSSPNRFCQIKFRARRMPLNSSRDSRKKFSVQDYIDKHTFTAKTHRERFSTRILLPSLRKFLGDYKISFQLEIKRECREWNRDVTESKCHFRLKHFNFRFTQQKLLSSFWCDNHCSACQNYVWTTIFMYILIFIISDRKTRIKVNFQKCTKKSQWDQRHWSRQRQRTVPNCSPTTNCHPKHQTASTDSLFTFQSKQRKLNA